MANERKFAGSIVKIDSVTVGKITDLSFDKTISEVEVTGAEDVMLGSDILEQKFVSAKIGSTMSLGGIIVSSDAGQSDLSDAVDAGTIVTIRRTYSDGSGWDYLGFFTTYKESGSVGDAIYKFSGTFRINSKSVVV